jgi:RNA polymerase sigma factor (sigma-70 family)
MRIVSNNFDPEYTDAELVEVLKERRDRLAVLYKRHKEYCTNFMKSMYKDHMEVEDIYHDAVMAFYEKVNAPGFQLTCSVQTYLNSICRNQILKRINHSNRYKIIETEGKDGPLESINDTLTDLNDVNSERIQVMKQVLEQMKDSASKCYEILVRFWYKNQNMDTIATHMQFGNADSAKSQKAKCQKQFKLEVFNRLMSEQA